MRAAMKYVLWYETDPDGAGKAAEHFPAHRERWGGYRDQGLLLAIGPFTDGSAAMGVFSTREAAEEFAADDPFVLHGVIRSWHVLEWNEALL
jgi:uncharacterized protein YciI